MAESVQITLTSYAGTSDLTTALNQVKYVYDSWGNVVKTYQAHNAQVNESYTPYIEYVYSDGAVSGVAKYNRLTQVIYPSGETVYYLYPTSGVGAYLSRVASISADSGGNSIYASYLYIGSGTIVTITHPQVSGTLVLSYGSDGTYGGWDRFGRVEEQLWTIDDEPVDDFVYTYDRSSNVLTKDNMMVQDENENHLTMLDECYSYDDLDRLIDANRNGTDLQSWTLDPLGNWAGYTDGATTLNRATNAANEITDLDTKSSTNTNPTYDLAGNMTSAPLAGDENTVQHYVYNAWNKMVKVYADDDGEPGDLIVTYKYDGLGRRIQKYFGANNYYDTYLNESWQEVETRKNGDADAWDTYIYDLRYVDAVVVRMHDDNTDGDYDNTLHYTQDANFNVMSLILLNGTVAERYIYTPYGMVTVLESDFSADGDNVSDYGNVKLYQGVIQDSETLFYYSRARYRHINLSWTQRDPNPEGINADGMNFYGFVQINPIFYTDYSGLYATTQPINNTIVLNRNITGYTPNTKYTEIDMKQRGKAYGKHSINYNFWLTTTGGKTAYNNTGKTLVAVQTIDSSINIYCGIHDGNGTAGNTWSKEDTNIKPCYTENAIYAEIIGFIPPGDTYVSVPGFDTVISDIIKHGSTKQYFENGTPDQWSINGTKNISYGDRVVSARMYVYEISPSMLEYFKSQFRSGASIPTTSGDADMVGVIASKVDQNNPQKGSAMDLVSFSSIGSLGTPLYAEPADFKTVIKWNGEKVMFDNNILK